MSASVRPPLSSTPAIPEIRELISHLEGGPLILNAEGKPVAVLIGLDEYRDLRAVYDWHERVLHEGRD